MIIKIFITAVVMLALGVLYVKLLPSYGNRIIYLKGAVTLTAFMLAVSASVTSPAPLRTVLAAGILFCAMADVALELNVLAGVALFGIAHALFIAAFFACEGPGWYTYVIAAAVAAGILIAYRKMLPKNDKVMLVGGICYVVMLGLMTGMAVTAGIAIGHSAGAWAAAGGILFAISDLVVIYEILKGKHGKENVGIMLALYYSSVFAIGVFTTVAPAAAV